MVREKKNRRVRMRLRIISDYIFAVDNSTLYDKCIPSFVYFLSGYQEATNMQYASELCELQWNT